MDRQCLAVEGLLKENNIKGMQSLFQENESAASISQSIHHERENSMERMSFEWVGMEHFLQLGWLSAGGSWTPRSSTGVGFRADLSEAERDKDADGQRLRMSRGESLWLNHKQQCGQAAFKVRG